MGQPRKHAKKKFMTQTRKANRKTQDAITRHVVAQLQTPFIPAVVCCVHLFPEKTSDSAHTQKMCEAAAFAKARHDSTGARA